MLELRLTFLRFAFFAKCGLQRIQEMTSRARRGGLCFVSCEFASPWLISRPRNGPAFEWTARRSAAQFQKCGRADGSVIHADQWPKPSLLSQ